jgi:diguanylate cyclase (GGDEF)-like protein
MIYLRGGLPRQRLSGEVYAELVDMLFRAITPLISMAVLVTGIGAMMFWMTGDVIVGALTVASFVLTLARLALNLAYRRRRGGGPMPIGAVKTWECGFGAGSVAAALLLGLLNVRALIANEVAVHMLVAALTFGFSAGAVIRLSVRPIIAALTLFAVVSLTFLGFVTHAQTSDGQLALAYGGQALLLAMFALGAIEMVNHLYRTTVQQLTTKAELSHLARKDALTGLANRIALRESFDEEMIKLRRSGAFLALHFLDLDRFKAVNDNHGHPTGDALLKLVAGRLTRMLRAGDTAARLGGDEFVVLQVQIREPAEAEMLARRIVEEISAPYSVDGAELNIGVSVGVALAPSDGFDLDDLAARGDAALYEAKSTRRGAIRFSTPIDAAVVKGAA